MRIGLIAIVILFSFCATQLYCQPENSFAFGLQAAPFPLFGISAKCIINPQICVEMFGRPQFANTAFIALRGQYLFIHDSVHNIHATGLIGSFKDCESDFLTNKTDTAPGYGIGIGYEHIFSGVPNLAWNAGIDYIYIKWNDVWWVKLNNKDYFSLVMLGFGFHYYL